MKRKKSKKTNAQIVTEKEMRKLNRMDLLNLLLQERTENESLRQQLAEAQAKLSDYEITCNTAGSIADAALQLTNIFAEAESACQIYKNNLRRLNERQEILCRHMEQEAYKKLATQTTKSRRR